MTTSARYRLGIDVGGTHTDLVLLDTESGDLLIEKVASTPKNPAHGVLEGIARHATAICSIISIQSRKRLLRKA